MLFLLFLSLFRRRPNAAIQGVSGLSLAQVRTKIQEGWRFVQYRFTISFVIFCICDESDVFLVPSGSPCCNHPSSKYQLMNSFLGFWSPSGIIFTIYSLIVNCRGGRDVTASSTRRPFRLTRQH